MTRHAGNRNTNTNRSLLTMVLVLLMMGSLIPLLPGTSAQQGESDEWEKGDSWSIGFEEELSLDFDYQEFLAEFIDEEVDMGDSELDDIVLEVDGLIGAYYITEVVETSPSYKLKVTASFGLHGSVSLETTGEMYEPGHHTDVNADDDGDWLITRDTRSSSVSADFDLAFIAEGYEYREPQTLAITRQTFSMESAGLVKLETQDLIDVQEDWNWEDDTATVDVSYNDFEVKVSWDVFAQMSVEYSPGLESRPRGQDVGDLWNLSYTTTTSGTYGGELKLSVEGDIPDDDEGYVSLSETMDLSSSLFDSYPFEGGVIHQEEVEVEAQQEIVGREMVMMPDGTVVDCFVIAQRELYGDSEDEYFDDELGYYYYSPSHQRTVQMKGAQFAEPELADLSSDYILGPESVSSAQDFNRRYANPGTINQQEEADSNFLLAAGLLAVVAICGFGFVLHQRRETVERPTEQTFDPTQRPAQSFSSYGPYQGVQGSPVSQGQPTTRLCSSCGTAAQFVPNYQAHYCWSCKRYLPTQQGGYSQPRTGGGLPSLSMAQTQEFSSGQPKVCRSCGAQARYVSIYQRHYCDVCREYA